MSTKNSGTDGSLQGTVINGHIFWCTIKEKFGPISTSVFIFVVFQLVAVLVGSKKCKTVRAKKNRTVTGAPPLQ